MFTSRDRTNRRAWKRYLKRRRRKRLVPASAQKLSTRTRARTPRTKSITRKHHEKR